MNVSKFSRVVFLGFAVALGIGIGAASHLHSPSQALAATASAATLDANIFVKLSKQIVPSVVNISSITTLKSPYMQGNPDDLFRRFFEDFFRQHGGGRGGDDEDDDQGGPMNPPGRNSPKAMSLGTGFIIDESGLILTNNHVVADADEIKIQFTEEAEEKPSDGTVVGRDPELDLALIKVKSKRQMVPVKLGDSDALEVGEYVVAVGNPFGQGHTVTHGIISAKERKLPELALSNYLQTDAPINPGNSGGPLLNLKGEVIGINNAIDQRAQGIGFAIPINAVKKVLPQLREKGTVARGYIGVLVNELTPELAEKMGVSKDMRAPFVTHVYPGEPADKAGLKPYDVIVEFNGKPIHSSADLIGQVTAVPVNDTVPMKIIRSGESKTLQIKVAQRPGSQKLTQAPKDKKESKHPDFGMDLEDLNADNAKELGITGSLKGVVVSNVRYGSPADKAGLIRGDLVVEVERKAVKDVDQFYSLVKDKNSVLLRVRRLDPQGREVFTIIIMDMK